MRRLRLFFLGLCLALTASAAGPGPGRVAVEPMQTSIYVASVSLVPGVFIRQGDQYTATYEVKVWPWFFWGETGSVIIRITPAQLAQVMRGEKIEFAGDGVSQKNRPRVITGRLTPDGAAAGKIKIRITADGYTLVFNGAYRFVE
jgi:hypothetical protein